MTVLLQKSAPGGLFSSKQYWVLCDKVFPVVPISNTRPKEVTGPAVDSSDSSDSDSSYEVENSCSEDQTVNDSQAQSSEQPTRPLRNRSKPQRYGIDTNDNQFIDGENDLIPSWYPGWDRAETRDYIDRYNGN